VLSTRGAATYTASRRGDKLTSVANDDDRIHVYADNHGLPPGNLRVDVIFYASAAYPDGNQLIATPLMLDDITLVTGAADLPTTMEIEAVLPTIRGEKGDPFLWEDFTVSQIELLQSPASQAAEMVTNLADELKKQEEARESAEADRADEEASRTLAEEKREEAEAAREAAEQVRVSSEQSRVAAEETREANDRARASASDSATARANAAADSVDDATAKTYQAIAEANEAIGKTEQVIADAEAATSAANTATEATKAATATANETLSALTPFATGELYAYGVRFSTAVSSPLCTRLGRSELHKTLPIQSRMRGCLLDNDGKVVEYLDPTDWTKQTRDGSRGQVMVEIPAHYRRFVTSGTLREVWVSEYALPGFTFVPLQYVSAYQATVQRSTLMLASVASMDADYRGGNNNANYDGTYRTLLGRPATVISRTNFRTYARKRKSSTTEWNCMTYQAQKTIYWLFVIEYANLNSQAAYNAELTGEGYHQGGLGDGVTTWSGDWNTFNGYYPFVPCGHTDSLGNGTGTVSYTADNTADGGTLTKTFAVPRYRGIENPFGHIWQWTDGINLRISPTEENGGDGLSKVFVCDDPANFSDTGYTGYSHVGNASRASGYIKEVIFGETGDIMPAAVGGGTTSYFCDYFNTSIPTTKEELRGVLFGGYATYGASAGLVHSHSSSAPSGTAAYVGSRLCFTPAD
jgi:hypothetical protein